MGELNLQVNWTPEEVSSRLRVSLSTLAHWRVSGFGPHYIKLGRKVLYPMGEIEAFEARSLRSAVSVPCYQDATKAQI